MMRRFLWFLFQPAARGALPTLFAATSPDARGGAYYGPDTFQEVRGYPGLAKVPALAADKGDAARLWMESEALTGVIFASNDACGGGVPPARALRAH